MPPPEAASSSQQDPAVPWRLVAAFAAVPAAIAVLQLGRIHPDEVYQALEPAYGRAFGYGVVAWEWQVGLRNWAVPLLLSWLLRGCAALGIRDPLACRAVLEVPQALLHAAMLAAAFRFTARRVGEKSALWALPAVGLYGPVLTFAGRTLGESISTAFLVIAVELLDRPGRRAFAFALGGAALGLAVVARYGSAVVVVAALSWLLAARRFRAMGPAAAGGLLVALALGGLDWATWGAPFHSLRAYLDFNLLSGKAGAQFGREPWGYYLWVLLAALPLWAFPGLLVAAWRGRPRVSLPLFCAAAYLAAVTLTAHKEHRFLYPALVLLTLAALPGALAAVASLRRPDLRLSVASLLLPLSVAPYLLVGELEVQRPDQFRAIVRAGRAATGLLIVNEGLWGAGGYFYLGKNIPWTTCDVPTDYAFQAAMADARFNRVVTYDGRAEEALGAAGFRRIEQIGAAAVFARGP
ncbi:MAG: glycosyltransferase family protein [Myxococcaceae bacterium]